MRRQIDSQQPEDLSGQAGWMYADLFLALMVIFLATISFVPVFDKANSSSPVSSYAQIYKNTLNLIVDKYDATSIDQQVNQFLKEQKYSTDAKVVYAQIVGGYNPNTESAQVGIQRAVNFSKLLDRGNPSLMNNSALTLSVSTNIQPNQTVIRLTFASRIGVNG